MVENNNSINKKKSQSELLELDDIYLHHKNRHFKHNPYIGYTIKELKKNVNGKNILNTNSLGLRCEELSDLKQVNSILLGGSVAFSSCASEEKNTISSLLEKNTNKKILNCGIGGHILKQHISLYFNYLKSIETNNIILLFGFNDMANCYAGRRYEDIINQEFSTKIQKNYTSPFSSSIKNIINEFFRLIKINKFIYDFFVKKNQGKKKKLNTDQHVQNYINEIKRDVIFFDNYCKKFNINLIILLQPCIYSTNKKLSAYEQSNYQNNIKKDPQKFEFVKKFYKSLDENLNSFNNFYNLDSSFNQSTETIFFDELHLLDDGNLILSDYIKKILV